MIIGSLCLIPIKIRQKVNVHPGDSGLWRGRGVSGIGSAVAAADYPPIRHKNNFLIYEESSRAGYWAPRAARCPLPARAAP